MQRSAATTIVATSSTTTATYSAAQRVCERTFTDWNFRSLQHALAAHRNVQQIFDILFARSTPRSSFRFDSCLFVFICFYFIMISHAQEKSSNSEKLKWYSKQTCRIGNGWSRPIIAQCKYHLWVSTLSYSWEENPRLFDRTNALSRDKMNCRRRHTSYYSMTAVGNQK